MEQSKLEFQYFTLRQSLIERYFAQLNDQQRQAVLTTEGAVLILAGAGSGKTTVLIERILHLLKFGTARTDVPAPPGLTPQWLATMAQSLSDPDDEQSRQLAERYCENDLVRPWEILAITFTNKAANELKERLEQAVGPDGRDVWAQTFHSACVRMLRRDIERLGYPKEFAIYDEDDKKKLLTTVIRRLDLDEKMYDPKMVGGEISRAKDRLQSAGAYCMENAGDTFRARIGEIYREYERQMKASGALDFDDLIVKTVRLLQEDEEVRAYYQRKFRYVLVDEYQDTNYAQYVLTELLAGGHGNICVVGDDDQSIYKFRGATIANILEFEQHYPSAKVIRLEENYRSTGHILDAANHVIANNKRRKGKQLWTRKGEGSKIHLFQAENQEEEAEFVAQTIKKDYARGIPWNAHAVLYRNHVLSNNLEAAFRRNSIPYRIYSGARFFDRTEVKDMLAYLWVIQNPGDELRLKRIINVPARKIGAKTVETAEALARERETTLFDVIAHADTYPELSRSAQALGGFAHLILTLQEMEHDLPLHELYEQLLEMSGYRRMLMDKGDEVSLGKLENVLELKSNIVDFQARAEQPTLRAFLEEISLFTDLDNRDVGADAVLMMTMHGAKGLEFPTVFLCGMEEGLFPSQRSLEKEEDREEERRLCYVAMTRAKKELYLTFANCRMMYGQTRFSLPSSFLDEIPKELLDGERKSARSRGQAPVGRGPAARTAQRTAAYTASYRSAAPTLAGQQGKAVASPPPYQAGQRVVHKAFGAGTISQVQPMGGDLLLTIDFGSQTGVKRLMAKSASAFMKIAP